MEMEDVSLDAESGGLSTGMEDVSLDSPPLEPSGPDHQMSPPDSWSQPEVTEVPPTHIAGAAVILPDLRAI